ncbi:MAG: insulinase family protein [Candidatus Eisenbacteria sp.]|nr:insulinase family protein [Candidatus Eisenbacteria bacterium]
MEGSSVTTLAERVQAAGLRNGTHVYLLESHTHPTVDLVGFIEGGLFIEDPLQAGVANLSISMLDRGTRRRDQAAISEALESNGARLSYGLTPEVVILRGRCLSEDLELLLDILGDTLLAPTFPENELRLVKEEAQAGLREAAFDTYARAHDRGSDLLLGRDHPYARDPLGREEILDELERSDLEVYHRAAVAGARMWLAVVGDFDPGRMLALLEQSVGALPRGEELALGQRQGLFPTGIRREHVHIADKEQVDIVFMRPGVSRTDPRFDAFAVANFLFGGSFVSRLNLQLRDAEGLTYGAQSTVISGLHPGFWCAYVGVNPSHVEKAVEGTLREMERFAEEGVRESELEIAQQHLTGSFPIKLETNRAVAAVLLDGIRSGRGLDFIDRYAEYVRGVTPAQVNEAARSMLSMRDVVIASAGTRLSQGVTL